MQSMSPFLLRLTMCGAAAVFAGGFLFAEASDEPGNWINVPSTINLYVQQPEYLASKVFRDPPLRKP